MDTMNNTGHTWNKIGKTHQDKYPNDHSKEVQWAAYKDGRLMVTWIGRNMRYYDNQIEPTHWRYITI